MFDESERMCKKVKYKITCCQYKYQCRFPFHDKIWKFPEILHEKKDCGEQNCGNIELVHAQIDSRENCECGYEGEPLRLDNAMVYLYGVDTRFVTSPILCSFKSLFSGRPNLPIKRTTYTIP